MRIAVLAASIICCAVVDDLQSQCPVQQGCGVSQGCAVSQGYVVTQGCPVTQSVQYPSTCCSVATAHAGPIVQTVSTPSCACNATRPANAHVYHVPAPCGSQAVTAMSYSVVPSQSVPSAFHYSAPATVYSTPAVGHQGIVYATPLPTQNSPVPSCNCGSLPQFAQQPTVLMNPQFSAQAVPQSVANSAGPQSPFSLSGYVRPPQSLGTNPCTMQFLRCCKYGGENCAYNYYLCSQATGEPMQHRCCPGEEPAPPDEKTPPVAEK